jgi:hypothetical protein
MGAGAGHQPDSPETRSQEARYPVSQFVLDKSTLRRLLKRPHGFKVLEEVLAEGAKEEKARKDAENKPIDRPVVAILVPSYKCPHPRMQSRVLEMKQHTLQSGVAYPMGMPLMRNSVVHWQRNDLIAELIKSERAYTHVLFIDDDIVPELDSLNKLLAHGVDIVAGLCTFRQDPPVPNARYYDEKNHRFAEMRDWSKDGLIEVDAVGTGMMLISANALQKVADVWFKCEVEKALYGLSDEKVEDWNKQRCAAFDNYPNAWWFQFLPTPDAGVREFGEDISFCHKAKKYAGLKVWVDTTVTPEHIGEYGYSIADYKSQRRVMQERKAAKAAEDDSIHIVEDKAGKHPFTQEAYSYWLNHWSDMQDHLPLLKSLAKGNVMEIGVRTGVSTSALLSGVIESGGHLWSFDINPCDYFDSPQATFTQADTINESDKVRAIIPERLDLLFVDGDHTLEGALSDLRNYGPLATTILVHDAECPDTFPGVLESVKTYCAESGRPYRIQSGSYGLAIIE